MHYIMYYCFIDVVIVKLFSIHMLQLVLLYSEGKKFEYYKSKTKMCMNTMYAVCCGLQTTHIMYIHTMKCFPRIKPCVIVLWLANFILLSYVVYLLYTKFPLRTFLCCLLSLIITEECSHAEFA